MSELPISLFVDDEEPLLRPMSRLLEVDPAGAIQPSTSPGLG